MAVHVIYPVGEAPHPADVTMILEAALWSRVPGAPEAGCAGRRAADPGASGARGPAFPYNPELQAAWVMVLGIPRPPNTPLGGSYLGGCVRDGRGGRARKVQDTLLPQAAAM